MTLAQLLQTDLQARVEYEAALKTEREAGAKSVQARIDAAKPYLALTPTKGGYDAADVAQIAKLAAEVIAGAEEPSALRAEVRQIDREVEKRKAAAAIAETNAQPATPAQQQTVAQAGAVVGANPQTAEVDLAAVIAKDRAAQGRPVAVK